MRNILVSLFLFLVFFAQAHAATNPEPDRPVVLVPGILGSRLCDDSGQIIWGGRSSLSNFYKLEITGQPSDLALSPCGIIEEIQILGRFWSKDQYNLLIASLNKAGFSTLNGKLIIFDYDWRQSNLDSAKALDKKILDKIGEGQPFDIIAHSMGGIVSRIYAQNYPSAQSLKRVIYLGTPFLGSMNTFGTIQEGWGWFQNQLAGGLDVIWRVSLSFPAMLELLPRYSDCCYVRTAQGEREPLDVFDAETWKDRGWLPEAYNSSERFSRFATSLGTASNIGDIIQQPAPVGIWEILFAGDVHATLRRMGMRQDHTSPGSWFFSEERGDGTVPVWSAARRPDQSGYENSLPSYGQHKHIFKDKWVTNKLLRSLLKVTPQDPDPVSAPGRPSISIIRNGLRENWSVDTAKLEICSSVALEICDSVVDVGDQVAAKLSIKLEDGVFSPQAGLYIPSASIISGDAITPLTVEEMTTPDDLKSRTLRFKTTASVPKSGIHQIQFQIVGDFAPTQTIYALDED